MEVTSIENIVETLALTIYGKYSKKLDASSTKRIYMEMWEAMQNLAKQRMFYSFSVTYDDTQWPPNIKYGSTMCVFIQKIKDGKQLEKFDFNLDKLLRKKKLKKLLT